MKRIAILFFFTIVIFSSCTKENTAALVGEWGSVSFYMKDVDGRFNWISPSNFSESIDFAADARFQVFTDIPSGSGTYEYDRAASRLSLHFEADVYGNSSRSETRQVEKISETELVVSLLSPAGELISKTAYTRLD